MPDLLDDELIDTPHPSRRAATIALFTLMVVASAAYTWGVSVYGHNPFGVVFGACAVTLAFTVVSVVLQFIHFLSRRLLGKEYMSGGWQDFVYYTVRNACIICVFFVALVATDHYLLK